MHSKQAWCGRVLASAVVVAGLGIAGCGTSASPVVVAPLPPPVIAYTGPSFPVRVLAGSTPVVGATLKFFSAGSTGNGSAPVLLGSSVVTDANGAVTVPSAYTCPSSSTLTYLTATGGTVGTTSNSSLALMTAIGPCGGITTSSTFVVNEATTVAAVYSLAQFYAGGQIGASSTNLIGLTNAFLTASTLANPATGSTSVTALPANGVSPAPRVNSIANALNACLVKSSNCTALYAQSPSGTPANTLDAVYYLALYPGKSPANVYLQSQLSTVYSPALTVAPLDWTMFVNYTVLDLQPGDISSPTGIAIDSTGSVWVANYFNFVTKFSPAGARAVARGYTGGGLSNSYGLALDTSDNAWVTNEVAPGYNNSISEISPSGVFLSGANGYTAGGLNFPSAIAIDSNGTSWIVDNGNSHVTLLNKSGVPLSGPDGYTSPYFAFPDVVAIDANHYAWFGNISDTAVVRMSPDGTDSRSFQCCHGADGIALDASNNVWIANYYGDSVSMISSAGVVVSNQAYTGSGAINHPQGIAIDGAGNVFVSNFRAGYLTEIAGINSPTPGATISVGGKLGADAALLESFAIAIDSSGNLWSSNLGNNSITKFVGLASPVKTPLSVLPKTP